MVLEKSGKIIIIIYNFSFFLVLLCTHRIMSWLVVLVLMSWLVVLVLMSWLVVLVLMSRLSRTASLGVV